jgi:hypothetical protein
MTNPHQEASERVASAVATLPPDFLGKNVEALFQILHELERSHAAQLQIAGPMRRLDLDVWRGDLISEVRTIRIDLEDASDSAVIDRWRTHCHSLRLLARRLVGEGWAVEEVKQGLGPLYSFDEEFIDQLETFVAPALAAAQKMERELVGHEGDDVALARARAVRDEFVEQHRRRLTDAKSSLITLGDAIRALTLRL